MSGRYQSENYGGRPSRRGQWHAVFYPPGGLYDEDSGFLMYPGPEDPRAFDCYMGAEPGQRSEHPEDGTNREWSGYNCRRGGLFPHYIRRQLPETYPNMPDI